MAPPQKKLTEKQLKDKAAKAKAVEVERIAWVNWALDELVSSEKTSQR